MAENINQKENGSSLFVATPMYGGLSYYTYVSSLLSTKHIFDKVGIPLRYQFLANESLITRARNFLTDVFMDSDFTHMMFIDGDIEFNPEYPLQMLEIFKKNPDIDILAGIYPRKFINWKKIDEISKKYEIKDPKQLAKFGGNFNVGGNSSTQLSKITDLVEVNEAGTGFMMIKKEVFLDYKKAYPQFEYVSDLIENGAGKPMFGYFMDLIENKRFLSEDYMFCKYAKNIGKKIHICPWMKLNHVGTYSFEGDPEAQIKAGLGLTG